MRIKLPDYTKDEMKCIITQHIHSKRDRLLLYYKLIDNLTFLQIAGKTGIPVSTITTAYYPQFKKVAHILRREKLLEKTRKKPG